VVLSELLAHATGTGGNGYVCLTGEPGSGKSALLAHLSQHSTLSNQPSTVLIRHFVGASPGSTDVRRTLRRLCHELKAGCSDITAEIPDDPEKLRSAFPDFLGQACTKKRVVILLDAVNQFDAGSYSAGLHWLPEELRANARVILSALDGPALEELRQRRFPPREIELQPLTPDDGEAIIEQFRKRYRKQFEPEQRAALLAKTHGGMPLYLLAALEELRTLGAYKEISQRIAELPPTTHELFAWIFKRLENDDGFRDASGQRVGRELVPRFAALLGAGRHGLSQRELAELLDAGDPQGNVAALLHLLRPYLMRRGELLDFYHGQFRAAAEDVWLRTDQQRRAGHAELADYFWRFRLTERAVMELPWQLRGAGQMERLKDYLADPDVLHWFLAGAHEYDLLSFWRELGDRYDIAEVYEASLAPYKKAGVVDEFLVHSLAQMASFLITIGRYEDALRLSRRVADAAMRSPDEANAAISLNNLGLVLLQKGNFRAAEPLIRRALQILEAIDGPGHLSVARVVDNLAWALREKGDYDGAERLYRRGLEIHERTLGRDHPDTAQSLNNLSLVLSAKKDYAGAESVLRMALKIRRSTLGERHPATATTLVNLAVALAAQGHLRQAEEISREALVIMDETLGPNHPVTTKTRAWTRGIPPSGDAAR
jgi:nephrocystin-3